MTSVKLKLPMLHATHSASMCMMEVHCAGTEEILLAADHDFSGLNITPSVKLIMQPPSGDEAAQASKWYDGNVIVSLKDATLQPSNPARHAAETYSALEHLGHGSIDVRF